MKLLNFRASREFCRADFLLGGFFVCLGFFLSALCSIVNFFLLFCERLAPPFDEGIKNTALSLIRALRSLLKNAVQASPPDRRG